MSTQRYFSFLQQMTKKLADTFLELNQICKKELLQAQEQKSQQPDVVLVSQIPAVQTPKANEIEIDSLEEEPPGKSDKTKKIKKVGNEDDERQSQAVKGKKKIKKVSHKPKAPPSSFLLFFKDQQSNISQAYPTYGVTELTKVAAKLWSEYSNDLKEPYIKQCEEERKLYQERMIVYRKEFPEQIAEKEKDRLSKRKLKNGKQTPKKQKFHNDSSKAKNEGDCKTQQNGSEGQKIIAEEEISDSQDAVIQEQDSLGVI